MAVGSWLWPRRRRPASAIAAIALAALIVTFAAAPSALASVTLPPGAITLPASGSFLYMNSQPGDYIGGGVERIFTASDSAINGSLPQGGDFFSASVIQGPYTQWFYVDIAAPPGQALAVGSYTGAVRASFRPPGTPGIDVFGNGVGCNTTTGQFDVNELSYAPTGELLVFDATFEQHCEGNPAALFGRIRIENPAPPPDLEAPTLALTSDISVEAPNDSGLFVGYSASATDDRDPNPAVTCAPPSGAFFSVGTTTVVCDAVDRSGNRATGSFRIQVLEPLRMDVTAGSLGSFSPRSGEATISGAVQCSRGLPVDISGTLRQTFANRVVIAGSFAIRVECTSPSTQWSATVRGDNGRFGAGAAELDVVARGCELSCHSAATRATLRLTGK
jgi:HYR domain